MHLKVDLSWSVLNCTGIKTFRLMYYMYEIFKMNLILLGKRVTFDGYFPFEVLIFVLLHENRFNDDCPDELCIIRVIYDIL